MDAFLSYALQVVSMLIRALILFLKLFEAILKISDKTLAKSNLSRKEFIRTGTPRRNLETGTGAKTM